MVGFFNVLIETATSQTRKIGEFTIPGLGKLVKAQRAARIARNSATGEAIKIKAKTADVPAREGGQGCGGPAQGVTPPGPIGERVVDTADDILIDRRRDDGSVGNHVDFLVDHRLGVHGVLGLLRGCRGCHSPDDGGSSRRSGGDGVDRRPETSEPWIAANPHVLFNNSQRGYVRCTVTPERWVTDYRVVEYVSRPGAPIKTRASFAVQDGVPGVTPV